MLSYISYHGIHKFYNTRPSRWQHNTSKEKHMLSYLISSHVLCSIQSPTIFSNVMKSTEKLLTDILQICMAV